MPSTPARKRTPAKKSSTPAGEASVADITSSMKKMKVNTSAVPFNFTTTFPYTSSIYDEGDDEMLDLFFFIPTLPLGYFLPDVINKGNTFSLAMRVPNFFFTFKRILLLANKDNDKFNKNTSEAQAHKKVCQQVDNHYGHRDEIIVGDPQLVQLPFSCEERIVGW
jgi:hypothetical protein